MLELERIRERLNYLGLTRMAEILDARLDEAAKKEVTYLDFLALLVDEEAAARQERTLAARTRLAHLPFRKTLAEFDFSFQPSIDERQIKELATLRFIQEKANLIFLGPPGVGKTHLAIALGIEALSQGVSVYFINTTDMINDLCRAYKGNYLERRMRIYTQPRVVICDEMGYLPLDQLGATLFFQFVSRRYEKGSIILTSNKSFGDWGGVFGDPILATAILDRLLHHSTVINIRGDSYRLKEKRRAGIISASPREQTPKPN